MHPTTQEDIAVLDMAITNADTLVSQRLAACSGSLATAFTYEWLSQNSEVLWLKRKLQLDFNEHPNRLYRAVNFIDTWAVDPDIISDGTLKQVSFWAPKSGKTQLHQALLLCYGKNRSGIVPPGDTGYIYSCAVVWTLHNQVWMMVPEAIHHIKTTAEGRGKGIATICSLPEHPPYWTSPDDTSVCNLVLFGGSISAWATPLHNLRIYHAITHYKDATMHTFIALNQGTSGRRDVKSDELAFYHIVPRGSLWPGETYVSVSNEGDLAPALNTIPVCTYEEGDEPLEPDDKSPVPDSTHDAPLASTVGDEPDRVVFVGPAQFQMADVLIPGSPEEQRDMTLDETTPPSTTPPAQVFPDTPPRRVIVKTPEHVVIKKELHAHVDGATAVGAEGVDGTTVLVTSSPKQVPPGTNAEGDLASDTTLSESIETGSRPTAPADHSYSFTGSQALDRDEAEEDEHSWIRKVCNLPLKLIGHSAVLDDAHTQIMSNFFDHIRVTHAKHLCDLNTFKSSVTNALRRWTTAVQERTATLGSNPGAATYNVAVDTVHMHSHELRTSLQAAETAYLVSKSTNDTCMRDHKATITAKLTTGIRDTIQAYLDGCVLTLLKYMGR